MELDLTMKKLLLSLLFALASSGAWAQCTGVFPANTVCGNLTGSPQPPAAFSSGGLVVGPGSSVVNNFALWNNTLGTSLKDAGFSTGTSGHAVPFLDGTNVWSGTSNLFPNIPSNILNSQTANYTAVTGDCGKTIALGGNATFTLTVGAASGFPANCMLIVANVDTWTSGRGKTMAINSVTFPLTVLYPQMSFTLVNVNNAWQVVGLANRARPPASTTLNIFTDFANGNDANDGLAAGTGNAKKTVQGCLNAFLSDIDFAGTILGVCNMLVGSTDTQGVHFSAHDLVGANGGAAILIQGNGGNATISPTGTDAIGVFLNTAIQLKNLTLQTTTGGDAIISSYNSFVDMLTGITFGPTAGNHIHTINHGTVQINNNYTISGNASQHYNASQGGLITNSGATTVTGGSQAFTTFAQSQLGGNLEVAGLTFSGMGAATGTRFNAATLGQIFTGGGGVNYFPGNAAGSANCTTTASSIGSCGMYN